MTNRRDASNGFLKQHWQQNATLQTDEWRLGWLRCVLLCRMRSGAHFPAGSNAFAVFTTVLMCRLS